MSTAWWQGITQRNIAKMLVLNNKEIPSCLVVLDIVDLSKLLMLPRLDSPLTFTTGKGSLLCSLLFNTDVTRLQYLYPLLFSLHTLIQFDVFILHLHICAFGSSSSFHPVIWSFNLNLGCTPAPDHIGILKNRTHFLCNLHSDSPSGPIFFTNKEVILDSSVSYTCLIQSITKSHQLNLQNVFRMHSLSVSLYTYFWLS